MSIKYMNWVWYNSKAKGSTLLFMLAIADNANDKGVAWPGLPLLALKTRMSRRQVIRLIEIAENVLNELEVTRRDGKSNIYRILTGDKMSLPDKHTSDIAVSPTSDIFDNNRIRFTAKVSHEPFNHQEPIIKILNEIRSSFNPRNQKYLQAIINSNLIVQNGSAKITLVVPDDYAREWLINRAYTELKNIARGILNVSNLDIAFVKE